MKPADLFPIGKDGTRSIYPHQQRLLDSPAKYVCMVGGYGAAKTQAACVLLLLQLLAVPGNRGIIIRRSYSKLHDSTLRVFMEVLERSGVEYRARENRDGFPHHLTLANDSELTARESKDLGRWLGPEFGVIYVDEAAEEPEKTFTDLQGRLRLPRAGPYLKFLLTTNPPHKTHWIPKVFGEVPGITQRADSQYHLIRCSTRENPNLPDGYLSDLVASQSASEVRRIVDGEYGFSPKGRPVFSPPFNHDVHVGIPKLVQVPLGRGWDFGHRHPAGSLHQVYRCPKGQVHWNILGEIDASGVESEVFADRFLAYTSILFPDMPRSMIVNAGDAQGAAIGEKGPGPIIRLGKPPYGLRFKYRKVNDIDPGLELVRKMLRRRCACKFPHLLIHRRCVNIIDGLAGGYHYPEDKENLPSRIKPVKDGYYDDFLDSVRYYGEMFVRPELRDPESMDAAEPPAAALAGIAATRSPWDWLEV